MKKSSIWKLLFSALTVFAVAVFAGCTDDNDDMGAPYLNVTPENLTFDAEGQPADEYNGTFIVETNRPWRAIVEDEQTWVRLSATEGEGDAAVTVTVPASNIGPVCQSDFRGLQLLRRIDSEGCQCTSGRSSAADDYFQRDGG